MDYKKILVCFLLITNTAFSYPFFVTCKDNKLIETDEISTEKTFEKILKLSKHDREIAIESWCRGSNECMAEFKQAIDLAQVSYDQALSEFKKSYNEQVQKLEDKFINTKDTNLEELLSLSKSVAAVKSCEDTRQKLSANDYVKNNLLIIAYPYHNNYMYITGCNSVDADVCSPMRSDDVEKVIKESAVMGVDPYTVLSLSMMEGKAESISTLYLDPIGVMASMGCSAKQVANGTKGVLDSYGTAYKVEAEIKSDKKLKTKLKKYFDEFSIRKEEGNSFYCSNVKGGTPAVQAKPDEGSCCIELGFKATADKTGSVARALVFPFIEQITRSQYKDKKDPSWRLQRYNGYTELMGGAEQVPAWRSGVNFTENPMYGQQTMDYMINGFMNNPWVKEKVKKYEEQYGNPESVMCKGRENGTFTIDTEMYFQMQKDIPRMSKIASKIAHGASFASLSSREKKVLRQELDATAAQNKFLPAPVAGNPNLEFKISQNIKGVTEIFPKDIIGKDEFLETMKNKTKYTSAQLSHGYEIMIHANEMNDKAQALSVEKNKEYATMSSEVNSLSNYEIIKAIETVHFNQQVVYTTAEFTKIIEKNDPNMDTAKKEKLIMSLDSYNKKTLEIEHIYKGFQDLKNDKTIKEADYVKFVTHIFALKPLEEYKKMYAEKIKADPLLEGELAEFYKTKQAIVAKEDVVVDYEKATSEYFGKIYSQRNTVARASNYKWERLDEEQTQKLMKKFK